MLDARPQQRCVVMGTKHLSVDWESGVYGPAYYYIRDLFTGLRDRDGKDFYEGHHVRIYDINRGCYCDDCAEYKKNPNDCPGMREPHMRSGSEVGQRGRVLLRSRHRRVLPATRCRRNRNGRSRENIECPTY